MQSLLRIGGAVYNNNLLIGIKYLTIGVKNPNVKKSHTNSHRPFCIGNKVLPLSTAIQPGLVDLSPDVLFLHVSYMSSNSPTVNGEHGICC